jgi:L-asparaginase
MSQSSNSGSSNSGGGNGYLPAVVGAAAAATDVPMPPPLPMSSPGSAPRRLLSAIHGPHKRVLIIYTGGTMGMVARDDGSLAPEAGYLTARINELPEMSHPEMPAYDIHEYDPLLDSSMMGPADWVRIAETIETHYLHYDGYVVIMGTDTMAYASSALSFMLENLGKTVVFTGSQIPFCEVYNDARRNLIVSIIFAVNSEFPEVCICFNDKLLRANRSIKVHSTGLSAFDSPNFPQLAELGAFIKENRELVLPQPKGPFRVHKKLDANVLVVKLVPGFDDECIVVMVNHTKNLRALVLEMYGTGNGPSQKGSGLHTAIQLARQKGIVVVALSQCVHGGVSLDTYSMGRELKEAGVVGGGDMTTEACTTKLAYLFGRLANDPVLVAQMLTKDLRGEISDVDKLGKKFFGGGVGTPRHLLMRL